MSNPSAAFLSPPPRIFSHTHSSLSATPSTNPHLVPQLDLASLDSTRDLSQTRSSVGQLQVSSRDPDPNGEQSRITMQTRVAVRDATPHRFQIIPLREHRLSNLPEAYNKRLSEPRYRLHELKRPARSQHAAISAPLSCASRVDENNKLASASSAYSLCVPQASTHKHKLFVSSAPDTQVQEKRACMPPSKPPLHQIKPENVLLVPPPSLYEHRNLCSVPVTLPLSSEHPDVRISYQRNVKPNIQIQGRINDSYIGSATGGMKCRVCSGDFTRCRDQKCTHGYLCLRCLCGDSSWQTTVAVTRRHAIYTDALLLPIISRGSSTRRTWRAPAAHNRELDRSPRNHHVGSRYSQGASIQTLDKGLRFAPGVAYSSLSANVVSASDYLHQTNTTAEICLPPVPRLRLSKKTRNLSTSSASFIHEGFAKHSHTVLELIAQLDLAINDWNKLERDHAALRATVQAI